MRPTSFILTLIVAVSLLGCDESINPILETNRQFTLFGTLDMAADTQFVRVIEIRPTLTTPAEKLDATFTSRRLDSQEQHVWKDSVHTFEDGSVGHIFYAPVRVLAGKTYQVDVEKPDSDIVTTATTQVPYSLKPSVQVEKVFRILTTQLVASQQVLWWSLEEEPYDIVQWYRFFLFDGYRFVDIRLNHRPRSQASRTHQGFWETTVDLVRDRDSLLVSHPRMFVRGHLVGLGMTITVLDDKFKPPGDVFTAAALGQPGTLSNVTNGFGYVGAVGRFSAEWLIQDTTATALGYKVLNGEAFPEIEARIWEAPIGALEL